jgi:8-oxo-dGTP pyrophosphatase MutT (NUDIX family)
MPCTTRRTISVTSSVSAPRCKSAEGLVRSGSVETVIERRAARVLLLADRSVLLIQGFDPGRPGDGRWWLTPGGGVDEPESLEAAAVREVLEETGFRLDGGALGPVVATRVADFEFDRRQYRQTEYFFAAEVPAFTPKNDGWEEVERRALLDQRWWTVDELRATHETVYPCELADLVETVLDGEVSDVMRLSGD